MARNRERFERTDVPRESPYKNIIGLLVVVVVFGLLYLMVNGVWGFVQVESNLGDDDIAAAVSGQTAPTTPDGYTESEDEFETVLLLTASSLDETGATLSAAEVITIDVTQDTVVRMSIPTTVKVTYDDTNYTLEELFSTYGYAACVAPLNSQANVQFDHVVVCTGDVDVLDGIAELNGVSSDSLVIRGMSLIKTMKTDMDKHELLELAQLLSDTRASDVAVGTAETYAETTTDEEGNTTETGYTRIGKTALGVALGFYLTAETSG